MRFENIFKRIKTEIKKINKKYFVAGGGVILALILVTTIYGINGNDKKEVILNESEIVDEIELTSTPTVSIIIDKKVTTTPTGVTASQANDTNTNNSSNNPQPTATISNIVATLTPTKIPTLVPTVTSTPYIQPSPKATPTLTPIPTQTPVPAVPTETVSRTTISISMNREGGFTPSGRGEANITAIKNLNGYWDFVISATINNLWPQRNYQLWLCGINCSSGSEARLTTTENGGGSITATINHNQGGDPVNRIVVWERPPGGEIPNDPTACFMHSNTSTPCLKGDIAF